MTQPAPVSPRSPRRHWAAWLMLSVALGAAAAQSPDSSPTLERVRTTGVIVMGYRPSAPPFSFVDARLKPAGYSVELCERVIAAVRQRLNLPDLEVKRVAVSSTARVALSANGTLDLECGVTTHTAQRALSQGFSITTFVAQTRLLTRRDVELQTLNDLRGLTVATTLGTTSQQVLNRLNQERKLGMRIVTGAEDPEAFELLRRNQADAYLMDDVLLLGRLALTPAGLQAQDYRLSSLALSVEPYALGLRRGDAVFKRLVDEVLTQLYRSGEIHQIYRRWFEQPIAPNGQNMRLPMSAALRRVIAQPSDSPNPAHYAP
ncbi:amino acid ABC transporter substrate-binding protein [Roseateles sp. BYS180W]|uniref:Amino acid ABC transporter substrate-binding protein n=1 Tax=Roseateles rivi TaxID=3299028 RepID=A0ABW7FT26_9BURK